jgi:hypothetical protein
MTTPRLMNSWITWSAVFGLYTLATLCALLFGADSHGAGRLLPLQPRKENATMKSEAISHIERASIIRQLADFGKWAGTRGGAHILMVRFQANGKQTVHYSARIGATTISNRVASVAEACDQVNQLVDRKQGRSLEPVAMIPHARPTFANAAYRLPYAEVE